MGTNYCPQSIQRYAAGRIVRGQRQKSSVVNAVEDDEQNPVEDTQDTPSLSPRLSDEAVRYVGARHSTMPRPECDQQRVIIEIFLNERSVKETADLLSLTVGNVAVLKNRALRTLRDCEEFVSALEDWLDSHS